MNVVIFGAGAVGRGLLAPIFCRAGHAVTFFETNSWIVSELCRRTYIPTRTSPTSAIEFIGPCRALNPRPNLTEYGDALEKYVKISDKIIAKADLIVTAVRVENLSEVAEMLAIALSQRDSALPVVPVWVCENTPNAARKFEMMVGDNTVRATYHSAIAETVVPEIPPDLRKIDPLLAYIDPSGHIIVDADPSTKDSPKSKGIGYSTDFAFDWDLKWYCHCALHAVVAFLGLKAGHTYIHEAMRDKEFSRIEQFTAPIHEALSVKHGGKRNNAKFDRIADRFSDELFQLSDGTRPDLCTRVARDAARKIQPGERLMDALALVGGKNAVIEEAIEYARGIATR